jgi:glycosyltransferase involved in cell wall biosynthesis
LETHSPLPRVLVLTPVKDAADLAESYFLRLSALTYPADRLSVGLLESDSSDGTYEAFSKEGEKHRPRFCRMGLWKKNFGYHLPPGVPRWEAGVQAQRRSILARSRNHLLFHALEDEDWVLWLDADVVEYPPDILQRLLATGKDIVQPHCVKEYGGPTYDLNAWQDRGRHVFHDLRGRGELVPLDAVGGTMLMVRADCHRDGLVFPSFFYGRRNPKIRRKGFFKSAEEGEIETEGLGILASDMNLQCWGLPHLEIRHRDR